MKEGIYQIDNRDLTLGASKYFFKLRTTISGKIQVLQNRYNQIQQSIPVRLLDVQESYSGKIQSKISNAFTMVWNFSYLNNKSRNTDRPDLPNQKSNQWMQQAELNFFPINNLHFRITCEQYQLKQNGQLINKALFGDIQVRCGVPKYKSEIIIECQNLTDQKIYSASSVNGFNTQQITYPLRPRIFLFSVQFHF
jgi:outer membrane receptor for ferrienterochelin and colicin